MTYRELVFMVLDECKAMSDDIPFTEDHVIFLLNKYRSYILKNQYLQGGTVPISDYQTICIDLERNNSNFCGSDNTFRSVVQVPFVLPVGIVDVYPIAGFNYGNRFSYVSPTRFSYVGKNKFLKNNIYATIGPDGYLYVKSASPYLGYLKKIKLTAVFEDADKANELSCDSNSGCDGDNECTDVLDKQFPIEDSLATTLIQVVVGDLSAALYRLSDNENNAADDTDDLAQLIARYTNNKFAAEVNRNRRNNKNKED